MDPIYVTGHRTPDTDSIVAAMAYAALRNALGDREYEAACLGHVSDETQTVLDRFGFKPPKLITGMYTQIKDLEYDTPTVLSQAVTVGKAWEILLQQQFIRSVPVANEDGTLYGILSRDDVANYNMSQVLSGILEEVPLFNALSVLEGRVLNDAGENTDVISGEVSIALPQSCENLLFNKKESIVLCGHQPDMYIHSTGLSGKRIAPHLFNQPVSGNNLSCAVQQQTQDLKFLLGQRHILLFHHHCMTAGIHRKTANPIG